MPARPQDSQEQIWAEAFDWVVELDLAPDDPAIKAGFQAWLASGEAHAAIYADVAAVWRAAPHLLPSASHRPEPALVMPPPKRMLSRRQWLAGTAAASIAAVCVTANLVDFEADHATGTGESKAVTLADGSRLQLDTNSAIRVDFAADQRQVTLLRGRAFFAVEKDAQRPFTVAVGEMRAIALDSRFDVRNDDTQAIVAVEEGHVAATFRGRELLAQPALTGGDVLTVDLTTGAAHETKIAPATIAAWRDDRLIVDGWNVAEVLNELGRYHRGVILLQDATLGARQVSGIYDLKRPIDAARAVAEANGAHVIEISPWLLLVSAV